MFGKNQVVGQSFFKDAGDKLFVTSIFGPVFQGEGPYRGEPATFVRLAKCQLSCRFCDTFFDDGDWMTVEEIDAKITKTLSSGFNSNIPLWADVVYGGPDGAPVKKRDMVLVLTGGEPMLQKNIVPFLDHMNKQFAKTQIESNGLIVQSIPLETTLVVSPKCSEKNGKPVKYLEPKKAMLERADCLKFVMTAEADSPYHTVPEWAHRWRDQTGKPVFASPMNIYNQEPQKSKQIRAEKNQISLEERSTVDEVISFWTPGLINMQSAQANHEHTAKYCVDNGMIFNMQLQLFGSIA
jgi:7-carboxy-7-deazaguanine synthase